MDRLKLKYRVLEEMHGILHAFHEGKIRLLPELFRGLQTTAAQLDAEVQQDTTDFIEQIAFCASTDPWHLMTAEICHSTDALIYDLGFEPPKQSSS